MIGRMVWRRTLHTDQLSLALNAGTSMTTLCCIVKKDVTFIEAPS